jgi:hypothetical protein
MGVIKIILHVLAALIGAILAAAYFMQFDYQNSFFDPSKGLPTDKRAHYPIKGGLEIGCEFDRKVANEKYYYWNCPNQKIKPGLGFPESSFLYAQLSAAFIAGILGIILIIVEILGLFINKISEIFYDGILDGIIFIVLGIPALGVALDLGISAGILGMIIGIIKILFGLVPSLKPLLN